MNLRRTLSALAKVVADEAARNPEFRVRIEAVIGSAASASSAKGKRKGGRRAPAVLDPIELAKHGESELRGKLATLDLQLLLDVVAQYGMDPGKLVMKWKDRERVIDRIVEISLGRATKGDAFRAD